MAPATGAYYAKVNDYHADAVYGCATGCDLELQVGAPPMPTPSATSTATRTPTTVAGRLFRIVLPLILNDFYQ